MLACGAYHCNFKRKKQTLSRLSKQILYLITFYHWDRSLLMGTDRATLFVFNRVCACNRTYFVQRSGSNMTPGLHNMIIWILLANLVFGAPIFLNHMSSWPVNQYFRPQLRLCHEFFCRNKQRLFSESPWSVCYWQCKRLFLEGGTEFILRSLQKSVE